MNGTLLHSLLPDLLSLFLWENASDHKLLSVSGFTERKRLTKKKKPELASLDGLLLCVCFDFVRIWDS